MSKADRRKRSGRKPKVDIIRQPNGQPSRVSSTERMHQYVTEARAKKSQITNRDDLPIDVLGILFGHKAIQDAEYNIGRKYESLSNRIYGAPNESPSAMFKEAITPPNEEDAVSVQAMSDEAAEALFMRMDMTLRNCGLVVHGLVNGAVRYCRYPRSMEQVAMIVIGLEALAKGHAPKTRDKPNMMHEAA